MGGEGSEAEVTGAVTAEVTGMVEWGEAVLVEREEMAEVQCLGPSRSRPTVAPHSAAWSG